MIKVADNKSSRVLIAGNTVWAEDVYQFIVSLCLDVDFIKELDSVAIDAVHYDFIAVFVEDTVKIKTDWINSVKEVLADEGLLTINIDGIGLDQIQRESSINVLGLNFSYPSSASPFMEVVCTDRNELARIEQLIEYGRCVLQKDPYVVNNGISARAYMLAAMTREAFYLVDNGYADINSIDRACRNDAGYYLPFTGNFLYMDLMGTAAYAMVMQELNGELSNVDRLPSWFVKSVEEGREGMESGEGFYTYQNGDFEKWQGLMNEFSKDIKEVITKYNQEYIES